MDEMGRTFLAEEKPLGQEYVRGMPSDLVWREVSLLGRALGSEWATP